VIELAQSIAPVRTVP